jgi:TPR repeat protein
VTLLLGLFLDVVPLTLLYPDEGFGCEADPIAATEWFLAAQAGNSDAAYHLAHRYDEARGVLRNRLLAAQWYRFAAKRVHVPAMHALAECYARHRRAREPLDGLALAWVGGSAATR